jgi:hypothetical protein
MLTHTSKFLYLPISSMLHGTWWNESKEEQPPWSSSQHMQGEMNIVTLRHQAQVLACPSLSKMNLKCRQWQDWGFLLAEADFYSHSALPTNRAFSRTLLKWEREVKESPIARWGKFHCYRYRGRSDWVGSTVMWERVTEFLFNCEKRVVISQVVGMLLSQYRQSLFNIVQINSVLL